MKFVKNLFITAITCASGLIAQNVKAETMAPKCCDLDLLFTPALPKGTADSCYATYLLNCWNARLELLLEVSNKCEPCGGGEYDCDCIMNVYAACGGLNRETHLYNDYIWCIGLAQSTEANVANTLNQEDCCTLDGLFEPAPPLVGHSAECYNQYLKQMESLRIELEVAVGRKCNPSTCEAGSYDCGCVQSTYEGLGGKAEEIRLWNQYTDCPVIVRNVD